MKSTANRKSALGEPILVTMPRLRWHTAPWPPLLRGALSNGFSRNARATLANNSPIPLDAAMNTQLCSSSVPLRSHGISGYHSVVGQETVRMGQTRPIVLYRHVRQLTPRRDCTDDKSGGVPNVVTMMPPRFFLITWSLGSAGIFFVTRDLYVGDAKNEKGTVSRPSPLGPP